MKKFLTVLIGFLTALFLVSLFFAGFFYWQNQKAGKEQESVRGDIKTFESRLYKFKLDYPDELRLDTKNEISTLPTFIRLADFENKDNPPTDHSFFDVNVYDSEDVKNTKSIKDYPSVKDLESKKYSSDSIDLDNEPAVRLTNPENHASIIYALYDKKIYSLNFTPSTNTAYEKSKDVFEKVIKGFKFLRAETASLKLLDTANAASACDALDQQYAPSTFIHSETIPTAAITGQTFKPTKNTVCRIDFELEQVQPNSSVILWLNAGTQVLAQKSAAVSNGWNSVTLPNTVNVTPESEYKILLSIGGGSVKWKGGETGSGGTYDRGHAIIGGFDENDFDFHFKEFAITQTNDGTGGGTNGGGTKTTPQQQVTPAVSQPAQDTTPPKKPFNLKVLELRLTGITQSYVDLEWDKVTDEDLKGYVAYYGEGSGDYYFMIDNGTANTIRIPNLLPLKKYFFIVKAYDKSGNLSEPSNEVEADIVAKTSKYIWWIPALIALFLAIAIGILIVVNKKMNKKKQLENIQT